MDGFGQLIKIVMTYWIIVGGLILAGVAALIAAIVFIFKWFRKREQ